MFNKLPVCPSCGSNKHKPFRKSGRYKDIVCRLPGEWSLIECEPCGLVYTSPLLSQLELLDYYPSNYSSFNPVGSLQTNSLGGLIRALVMLPYRLRFGSPDWKEKPWGSGRLLDVGCGAGIFLQKASILGWSCWGIDLSPLAVKIAQDKVPTAHVANTTFDDLDFQNRFEFINMSHVLEHLPEPRKALQKCFDMLEIGGKLQISIPNIGSLESTFFNKSWRGLDIPRHLVHFRPFVLTRLLEDIGFVSITCRPTMMASLISESLVLSLPESLRYRLFGSRIEHLLYLSLIFPASLSYFLGNAGAIEVTAIRSHN